MKRAAILLALILIVAAPAAVRSARSNPTAAAIAAGEPPLQEIISRQGYSIDTDKDEIAAPLFVKAGPGPVTHTPIAAYGLPKPCRSGWYRPAEGQPAPHMLWTVDAGHNKQDFPPLMPGAITRFDPGKQPFGLWVASAGFPNETVYSEDSLQRFIPRFQPDDRHKAHVFPVKSLSR